MTTLQTATPMAHATILFGHGSRDPLWCKPIEAVAERMRQQQPLAQVRCAYLELSAPDLPTVATEFIALGATSISITPMFLGVGRHAREDLPALVQQLRQQHPGVHFSLQAAIGEHPDVLALMARIALQDSD